MRVSGHRDAETRNPCGYRSGPSRGSLLHAQVPSITSTVKTISELGVCWGQLADLQEAADEAREAAIEANRGEYFGNIFFGDLRSDLQ